MSEKRQGRVLGVVIFSAGILLALVLIGIPVWADLEAALFDPGIQASARLTSLRCPVMITRNETATVRARLKNTLDRDANFFIRVHVTDGFITLIREDTFSLALTPGEAQWVEWPIDADDAAFERLVLVKATARGAYPLPRRGGTCGVMVLGVPFLTGNQVYTLGLAISLGSIIGGGWLWIANGRKQNNLQIQVTRFMAFLAAAVIIALFFSVMGWWLPGIIALVITLLTIGVFAGYAINDARS